MMGDPMFLQSKKHPLYLILIIYIFLYSVQGSLHPSLQGALLAPLHPVALFCW